MTTTAWNLLREPLLSTTGADGAEQAGTLPAVLAALSRGEERTLTRLRPHQTHAWHAFTVQLGAIAMHRAGVEEPWTDAERWETALLALTAGDDAPWSLVVDDLAKPGFMQPPVPELNLHVLKKQTSEPDMLDVLQLAKNHDVKRAKLSRPAAADWALALVAMQTTEGFGGNGNYGIARMNGGHASRVDVSLVLEEARFVRETRIWRKQRPRLLEEFGYRDDGLALLWCVPWDGTTGVGFGELDPYFIEVCRRVRLVNVAGEILARSGTSKVPRVTQDRKGNTGDIWTPISVAEGKALTLSSGGPTYARVHDWLFTGNWQRNPTLTEEQGAEVGAVLVRGLVRGQGTTDGYHERMIPVPAGKGSWLSFQSTEKNKLAELSRVRVELIRDFRRKVLRQALLAFLQGGPDGKLNQKDEGPRPFLDNFERGVDEIYFERIFADVGTGAEGALRFENAIYELGERALENCIAGAPVPSERRWRAIARAQNVFEGAARKVLTNRTAALDAEREAS